REIAREGSQILPRFRLENVEIRMDGTFLRMGCTCRRRRGLEVRANGKKRLLMIAGESATGLSTTDACLFHVLWPMMARPLALSARLSRRTFISVTLRG